MAVYKSQLLALEFDFKTISGALDIAAFDATSMQITANNVLYRGTPLDVSGAVDIAAAQVEITLNGTFDLSGSASDVSSGIYTTQTGTMTLGSSISVTPAGGGAAVSESNFLPTSTINLNFDGTLDFNDNDLTITDTSKVTVNYDGSSVGGSVDTELKIYSQGNNSYISTKAVAGTIREIDNVSISDATTPTVTSSSNYAVVEGNTTIATLTANEAVNWSITGGADEAAFKIDGNSGALSFSFTPDYETPVDTGFNNTYEVVVEARDAAGNVIAQTVNVSVTDDATERATSGTYGFERTTDLTDVDTGIGLFNKNVLINYLVTELSNNFDSLDGTDLAVYKNQLAALEFDFKTISGALDIAAFDATSMQITANNVLYRGTPLDVSGAVDIAAAQVEITLNGTFDLSGSASDVSSGIYTTQTGTMTLGSSISVTPAGGGAAVSESNFLPTSTINLNFDGTLDFNDNDLTITDTSKVTVNYDGSSVGGSVDTELKIYSQGNNSYISTKAVAGTIREIDNVSISDATTPTVTSSSNYAVVEGNTTIATLTANEAVNWSITGGADEAAFKIDGNSGALSFSFTPDYETPVDTGFNNTYEVVVEARDAAGNVIAQTVNVSVTDDATERATSGTYGFERTTDLTDVDTGIGLFNKNVLINYLVTELSNNFDSLDGTDLAVYKSQLLALEFDFKTISGALDIAAFDATSMQITANNVLYRGTPLDVSGAVDIAAAQVEITLNGTFDLSGSASDVSSGIYTTQTGTMTLGSSISVTPAGGGAAVSESNFLPTSTINLNFDGTLDFNDNDLTITDTSKVTVNYDGSSVGGSVDTELKIYSQGNNSYISTKEESGRITDIDNIGLNDNSIPAPPIITTTSLITNNSTPIISGTAENGTIISLFLGSDIIGTTKSDSSVGTFSVIPSSPLSDADYTLTVTATDEAGNTSVPSAGLNITVDTSAPAAPLITTTTALTNDQYPNNRRISRGRKQSRAPKWK